MVLVMMNLHGRCVNVRLEGFKGIWKVREVVCLRGLCQAHGTGNSTSSLGKESAAGVDARIYNMKRKSGSVYETASLFTDLLT